MCVSINDYEAKIVALEKEICSYNELAEELESELEEYKVKLSNISGLFKKNKKETLERRIQDTQGDLDACRDTINEKEVELQQYKQVIEEIKKSFVQSRITADVELTPDVIDRINKAMDEAVHGSQREELTDFVVVPRIDVSDM